MVWLIIETTKNKTFASKNQILQLATGLASLALTRKPRARRPKGRRRRRALPRKLRNVNYQTKAGTQSFGLNSTSLNIEKSYALDGSGYSFKIKLIDAFDNSEFVSKYTDWEYIKIEGFQVFAFPMMDKQRVYMNVQWNMNDAPDNLKSDDSSKLFIWPKLRNQAFSFIPPNVALHFPQTTSQYVRVNLRKEWISLNDMRVAYLNQSFPCELYFERDFNDVDIDLRLFVKCRFRRSTNDPIDTKTKKVYQLVKPLGSSEHSKVDDQVGDENFPQQEDSKLESEPADSNRLDK